MTSGERMVWAAAYVAAQSQRGATPAAAAALAAHTVASMHSISSVDVTDAQRAYLDDMLGTGAERVEVEVRTVRNVDGTMVGEAKVLR
jgi:hypothetical protein